MDGVFFYIIIRAVVFPAIVIILFVPRIVSILIIRIIGLCLFSRLRFGSYNLCPKLKNRLKNSKKHTEQEQTGKYGCVFFQGGGKFTIMELI